METLTLTATHGIQSIARRTKIDGLQKRLPLAARRAANRRGLLHCSAVFAEHLRPLRNVDLEEREPRNLLFAIDDSDAAESGAGFTLKHVARAGDRVHFVHVIVDNRAPSVSVGEIGVGSGNEIFYHSSSVDIAEAFPLKEYQTLLEKKGQEMMQRRLAKSMETRHDVETEYHLPILARPESASEIASIVSDLASHVDADLLTLVSPSSGVFLDCGSMGYHCYRQSTVPVILLPARWVDIPDATEKVVLILVDSEKESRAAMEWTRVHLGHVFEPYHVFVARANASGAYEIPQDAKDMVTALEETGQKLHPVCVVMYASSEKTVLEQLDEVPFLADYDDRTRYTIVLLPKLQPEASDRTSSGDEDISYSSEKILHA